jgi:Glycosyltransferase 61
VPKLGLAVEANARRALKAVSVHGLGALRRVGVRRFAKQMIDVNTLFANGPLAGIAVHRSTLEEPPRGLRTLPLSDEIPPLRGVCTTISLLDISDPGFSIRNGYLVDGQRRIVYEKNVVPSFNSLRIALETLEQPKRIAGTVAWLWNSSNYGHWLLYALSLVQYYRDALGGDPDYYYVGSPVRGYQIESLEMLGVPRERIVTHALQADRIVAAIRDRALDYDSQLLGFAGRSLAPSGAPTGTHRMGRRLFVSRVGATHRRLLNETEAAQALGREAGVELVSTDGMSLADEIALFRSAELVVGGHGAGLTNLVFAPRGTRVVDLAPSTYWDSLFAQAASVMGHSYALVRGRSMGLRLGVPASLHNFEIDVDRLVEVVRSAVDSPRASGIEPAALK